MITLTNLSKIGRFTVELTAEQRKFDDRKYKYYKSDVNTAVLEIEILKEKTALLLDVNVVKHVTFKVGNTLIKENLATIDAMKGLYSVSLNNIKGDAIGQIYIKAMNDIAVTRTFNIEVSNDFDYNLEEAGEG